MPIGSRFRGSLLHLTATLIGVLSNAVQKSQTALGQNGKMGEHSRKIWTNCEHAFSLRREDTGTLAPLLIKKKCDTSVPWSNVSAKS